MKTTDTIQNPWAGLSSYEDPARSARRLKFCGRDEATYDVTQLIDDNFLVTLYGKSGIGKTSLLNAGVFPALRREQYTPLSIRLGMAEEGHTFQDIIINAVERAIEEMGGTICIVNVVEEQTDQTAVDYLWNYFARCEFTDDEGRTVFPVVVFDQFEEVFRERESRRKTETLLKQIHYLIDENHALNDCIVDGEPYFYDFNFRFVISIREDDLYRLEDSIDNCALTTLKRCRYRLRSLSEQGVRDAILIPGEGLFLPEEENGIVKAIVDKSRNEDGSISTNIVSLLCNRIFVDFQKSNATHISQAIVDNFIKGNPFERFYNEATRGFSNREKSYIEDHLVDSTGRRNSIPESDFLLHVPNGAMLLEGDSRILQRTSTSADGGNYRVELIHDSFCTPLAELKRKREQRRKIMWFSLAAAIVLACIGLTSFFIHLVRQNESKDKKIETTQQSLNLSKAEKDSIQKQKEAVLLLNDSISKLNLSLYENMGIIEHQRDSINKNYKEQHHLNGILSNQIKINQIQRDSLQEKNLQIHSQLLVLKAKTDSLQAQSDLITLQTGVIEQQYDVIEKGTDAAMSLNMKNAFDACVAIRSAIESGSKQNLLSANNIFKRYNTTPFSTLRCIDDEIPSLNGHFIFNSDFIDSLIAGKNVYPYAQKFSNELVRRGQSASGSIYIKNCIVRKESSSKYQFISRGYQELAIITEPGGTITLNVYDKTNNKRYNDTKNVKKGMSTRFMSFDSGNKRAVSLELEIFNRSNKDISFVILSN